MENGRKVLFFDMMPTVRGKFNETYYAVHTYIIPALLIRNGIIVSKICIYTAHAFIMFGMVHNHTKLKPYTHIEHYNALFVMVS